MPTAREWATTLVNGFIIGSALTWLHGNDTFNQTLESWYSALHALISHRLFEGCIAVGSFAVAAFFFSALEALGARKLRTSLVDGKRNDGLDLIKVRAVTNTTNSRHLAFEVGVDTAPTAGFLPSTPAGDFVFWLLANVGIYLGLIDVSQRILGDSIDHLHFADPHAPSVLRMAVEVAFSVWAYDFLFWWIHASWHATFPVSETSAVGRIVRKWRGWHLQHHDHYRTAKQPLHPMATFHHHFLDATLQVCINIVVQQVALPFFPGPRHKLSKALHNVAVTYLLVEAHSGFDLPFMTHRLFPAIFGGSVRHQIHHQHGTVFFHQFFRYLDDLKFSV